ncbi:hypothetical protein LINGRAHAP2_LOCUS17877 [Linum grandiflorum]
MHLDIAGYLSALGWESTIINLPTEFSPLATKLFYSNLRSSRTFPNTFTTIVMDDHIRFSAQVFSCLLDIPIVGQVLNDEADLWRQGFDGLAALLEICPAFPLGFLPSKFQVNFLPSPLRLLHYFITRVLLPRSFSLDELLPLDIFNIWNAVHLQPISLPHLLILHISKAAKDGFPGDLPCAPLITKFLFNMGIDLYGLEMVGLQTITTPGDVLTAIDLSPPNSPDISSGGDDDSADADVDIDLPTAGINDTGTTSHAHAAAPANNEDPIGSQPSDNDLEYEEVEEVESDDNEDPGSPISSGIPNRNTPSTHSLMMERSSVLAVVHKGIPGPRPKPRKILACPSVMAEIKESFKRDYEDANEAKTAQDRWWQDLFSTKTPSNLASSSPDSSSSKRKRADQMSLGIQVDKAGPSSERIIISDHDRQISYKDLADKIVDLERFINLNPNLTDWAHSIIRKEDSKNK